MIPLTLAQNQRSPEPGLFILLTIFISWYFFRHTPQAVIQYRLNHPLARRVVWSVYIQAAVCSCHNFITAYRAWAQSGTLL